MKYLLVLVVVVVVAWLVLRRRDTPPTVVKPKAPPAGAPADTQRMLVCAHCGVHLPQSEAQTDGSGRPFCSEAHRLAGPR